MYVFIFKINSAKGIGVPSVSFQLRLHLDGVCVTIIFTVLSGAIARRLISVTVNPDVCTWRILGVLRLLCHNLLPFCRFFDIIPRALFLNAASDCALGSQKHFTSKRRGLDRPREREVHAIQ